MDSIDQSDVNLRDMTPAELLIYALGLEGEEPDAERVIVGVRHELGTLADFSERGPAGESVETASLGPVLELLARRLDVALELSRRARAPETQAGGPT